MKHIKVAWSELPADCHGCIRIKDTLVKTHPTNNCIIADLMITRHVCLELLGILAKAATRLRNLKLLPIEIQDIAVSVILITMPLLNSMFSLTSIEL